jgi:putative ABC transport system permease protein
MASANGLMFLPPRQVPLTRRLLTAHPARSAASAAVVGAALTLMLLLTGLWAGVRSQSTLFEDHTGAQLVVVSRGTDTLFADPSSLPLSTVDRVASVPGVKWAVPVRTGYAILGLAQQRAPVAFVGAVPGRPGAPWRLVSGRAARTDTEATIDRVLSDRYHLRVGGALPMLGTRLRIVGITGSTSMFMTPLVFVTERDAAQLLRSPGTTGEVLVGADQPKQVAARLANAGYTVRTPAQLHDASLALATRIFGAPLRLMVGVAFVAGTLIIALVSHLLITEQRRDLGVLRALGATGRRLVLVAFGETAGLTGTGAACALGFFLAGRAVIAAWRPQFPVLLTAQSLGSVVAAASVMALLAAVLPARRIARLDPASAFRSTA